MKRLRIIASTLIVASIIAINPIGASASEWKSNNTGWWYVDDSGNYVTGWKYIDGQWYYFDTFGWMLSNTTINGYTLGADGAWIQSNKYTSKGISGGSGAGDGSIAAANRNNTQQSSSDSHADYFKNADKGVSSGAGDGSIARSNRGNEMGDTTTTSTSASQKSTSGGWEKVDGQWYYYDANGQKKTGWIQDGGQWYYLNNDGSMAKDTTIDGYTLGSNGAWVQSSNAGYFANKGGAGGTAGQETAAGQRISDSNNYTKNHQTGTGSSAGDGSLANNIQENSK